MTAKEKAIDLVDKHTRLFKHYDANPRLNIGLNEYFKKCALKTVDQMMLVLPFTDINTSLGKYCIKEIAYLEQVRNEIKKL